MLPINLVLTCLLRMASCDGSYETSRAVPVLVDIERERDSDSVRFWSWELSQDEEQPNWGFLMKVGLLITSGIFALALIVNVLLKDGSGPSSIYLTPYARDLFLPLYFQIEGSRSPRRKAYLRHIGKHKGLLVSEKPLARGVHIVVDLGNLPEFSSGGMQVNGRVAKVRKVSKTHFDVWVDFLDQNSNHQVLTRYLHTLKPKGSPLAG
jgi:hypothetical protein